MIIVIGIKIWDFFMFWFLSYGVMRLIDILIIDFCLGDIVLNCISLVGIGVNGGLEFVQVLFFKEEVRLWEILLLVDVNCLVVLLYL